MLALMAGIGTCQYITQSVPERMPLTVSSDLERALDEVNGGQDLPRWVMSKSRRPRPPLNV
jgi:hypothetical protein